MIFGLVVAVIFGLVFGSFGSVILSRRGDATTLQQASSILWGRSECPHCKHRLHAGDLVPLLSFLFQRGKCRYCHKKIAWLYPILEIGTAVIFGLIYRYTRDFAIEMTLFWLTTGWILRLLLVYDVLWYEVHIPLVIFGGILVGISLFFELFPLDILWMGFAFFCFFFFLYWVAKWMVMIKYGIQEDGVGFGDVIIAPYLGVLLAAGLPPSWIGIDKVLIFVFFLMLSGMVGLIWYLIQNKLFQKKAHFLKKQMADQAVPFLPAMILGVVVILIFHQKIFNFFGF